MGGVVLETLTNRRLYALGACALVVQAVCFIAGALGPHPTSTVQNIMNICIRSENASDDAWYWRESSNCKQIVHSFDDLQTVSISSAADVVLFSKIPRVYGDTQVKMTPWFQYLIGVLNFEIEEHSHLNTAEWSNMKLIARLGYQNDGDDGTSWTQLANSTIQRDVRCHVNSSNIKMLECDLMQLFELGSVIHDFYLLNIRISLSELFPKQIDLIVIFQNGGFTKIWLSLKTIVFPLLLAVCCIYWHKITKLARAPQLLEKTLLALGISVCILNFPLEWLSILFDMPFLLLISDIRQGLFYAMLLCFWIIFAGEHLMDSAERNKIQEYWKHITIILIGCFFLFIFDVCERGSQLRDPFFTLWSSKINANLALAFIVFAAIAALCYLAFLSFMIYRVFRNISSKKTALPHMNETRRLYYTGLIYRFEFMMVITLICAAVTVIFFIISQTVEGEGRWEDPEDVQITSGFFTGVYGMWNIYVSGLLLLYSPSSKYSPIAIKDESQEEIEFSQIQTETSVLSSMLSKASVD